jgi:rhamnulokinase
MGVEVPHAITSDLALRHNVTNEGGIDGTYRLLKNIMGLWLVQECRRSFERKGRALDYAELTRLATEAPPLRSLVDPDDPRFLAPPDMPDAIAGYCRETGQPVPESEGQFVRCALESLALKYACVLTWLEELTGTPVEVVHVVGGGSRNELLNRFAAGACRVPVVAGPVEATVLGNVLIQARTAGELGSLSDLREVVRTSGDVRQFDPEDPARWDAARDRFHELLARGKRGA